MGFTPEQIAEMTPDQCRARIAEIRAMAARGDYSWSYDELVLLRRRVPEEVEAEARAEERRLRTARRRRN